LNPAACQSAWSKGCRLADRSGSSLLSRCRSTRWSVVSRTEWSMASGATRCCPWVSAISLAIASDTSTESGAIMLPPACFSVQSKRCGWPRPAMLGVALFQRRRLSREAGWARRLGGRTLSPNVQIGEHVPLRLPDEKPVPCLFMKPCHFRNDTFMTLSIHDSLPSQAYTGCIV